MNHGIDTGFLVAAEVIEHANHQGARSTLSQLVSAGDTFVLTPQVLAEFIHVVTDSRRFTSPLSMEAARDVAEKWWTAREIIRVVTDTAAVSQFFAWHRSHTLGRKRLLDTLLAATYWSAGVRSLLTTNPADFTAFGGFRCVVP